MKHNLDTAVVCVMGLGYVGLPLAEALAKSMKVIGFDVDESKVKELTRSNPNHNLVFTAKPTEIKLADFVIICVPTPVTRTKEPDLSFVKGAAEIISQNMKEGAIVTLESTVYPGATEEILRPILEKSGYRCGEGFKIAYSPERINPGDTEHTLNTITKIVAGMDEETTRLVAELYSKVVSNVFIARDIKTAEAAKVIENIQRDINIALVNEFSFIFDKMGLNTEDVLEAAATKWNFHRYSPGLVGGYCIPVNPYYLVYKAKELGYHPQVILAGRAINDSMPKHVAQIAIKALNNTGKTIKGSRVLLMGLTYKEDVADARESPAKEIIAELKEYGVEIWVYDPLLNNIEMDGVNVAQKFGNIPKVDGIIFVVAHTAFKEITLAKLRGITNNHPVLIDARGIFSREAAEKEGFLYRRL